jgi:replicative DNA helicase
MVLKTNAKINHKRQLLLETQIIFQYGKRFYLYFCGMETEIRKTRKPYGTTAVKVREIEDGMGKLPPQAIDLEEVVLGAIMLEKDALTEVIEILQPEMFYKDEHNRIFKAIKQLFGANKPIDILTVTNQLKSNNELDMVGGAYYISKLTNGVTSSANTEYHARIIIEKFIQRKLIDVSSQIIKSAYEDSTDVLDLLDKSQNELFTLTESNFRRGTRDMSDIIKDAIDFIENARKSSGGLSGIPSGYPELDRITGGWQKSDLLILAARPGMGKTAFALNMARNMAVDYKIPVAIFSLEMSAVQLVTRLMSAEAEIPADILRKGQVTDEQWQGLANRITGLSKAPIFIDDTAGLSVFELRAKCRKLKSQHDIQFVVIDYLQLMTLGGEKDKNVNREQEISTISRSLKALAKELEIPILALSQLSRDVEKRGGDKKPILSDLRESGAIEQDADIVMFIYRPGYYDHSTENNQDDANEAEINIAKHRNGKIADIPLLFIGKLAKFIPVEHSTILQSKMNDPYDNYDPKGGLGGNSFSPDNSFSSDNMSDQSLPF